MWERFRRWLHRWGHCWWGELDYSPRAPVSILFQGGPCDECRICGQRRWSISYAGGMGGYYVSEPRPIEGWPD